MAAYLFLAGRRKERELHSDLSVLCLAQSQDEKQINKQLDEWDKDQ